jgi:hypothetical protein
LAIAGLAPELLPQAEHFTHHLLLAFRLQADIDKAGAGDFYCIHPALKSGLAQQLGLQVFGQLAGVELEGFGQLHGGRGSQVSMGGNLGRLKRRLGTASRGQFFEGSGQRLQKFIFYRQHGLILRGTATGLTTCHMEHCIFESCGGLSPQQPWRLPLTQ